MSEPVNKIEHKVKLADKVKLMDMEIIASRRIEHLRKCRELRSFQDANKSCRADELENKPDTDKRDMEIMSSRRVQKFLELRPWLTRSQDEKKLCPEDKKGNDMDKLENTNSCRVKELLKLRMLSKSQEVTKLSASNKTKNKPIEAKLVRLMKSQGNVSQNANKSCPADENENKPDTDKRDMEIMNSRVQKFLESPPWLTCSQDEAKLCPEDKKGNDMDKPEITNSCHVKKLLKLRMLSKSQEVTKLSASNKTKNKPIEAKLVRLMKSQGNVSQNANKSCPADENENKPDTAKRDMEIISSRRVQKFLELRPWLTRSQDETKLCPEDKKGKDMDKLENTNSCRVKELLKLRMLSKSQEVTKLSASNKTKNKPIEAKLVRLMKSQGNVSQNANKSCPADENENKPDTDKRDMEIMNSRVQKFLESPPWLTCSQDEAKLCPEDKKGNDMDKPEITNSCHVKKLLELHMLSLRR